MINLKMSQSFKEKLNRGTCFALSLLMIAGLCGKAEAKSSTDDSTNDIVSLLSNEYKIINPARRVSYGVNIFAADVSFTPMDVNGNEVKPFIDDLTGTTYVPLRAVANLFNAKIEWDEGNKAVIIDTTAGINFVNNTPNRVSTPLKAGLFNGYEGIKIIVDGKQFIPTNVNGVEVGVYLSDEGTTYVPVRAISELFGVKITWEPSNHGVYLGKHIINEDTGEEEFQMPTSDAEILNLAKTAVDRIGKYAPLLEPYRQQVGNQILAAGDMEKVYAERYADIIIADENGILEQVAGNEITIFENLRFEFNYKKHNLTGIYDAKESYKSSLSEYNKTVSGEYPMYQPFGLQLLVSYSKRLEYCYLNIDQVLTDLNQEGIQKYSNRFDAALDQIEYAFYNKKDNALTLTY